MTERSTEPVRRVPGSAGTEDIRQWIDGVRRLPAIRVDKVVATRRALRECRFDGEDVLDATICRVCEDLGVVLIHDRDQHVQ